MCAETNKSVIPCLRQVSQSTVHENIYGARVCGVDKPTLIEMSTQ